MTLKNGVYRQKAGNQSKRPPEERDGRSRPRASGAGKQTRADGSPAIHIPPELRHLVDARNQLPKALELGPPSEAEQDAWLAQHAPDGRLPATALSPLERYKENLRPIRELDMGLALEICDRIADGQTTADMVRNWPDFPGRRSWMRWSRSDEVQAELKQRLEQRGLATITVAQRDLSHAAGRLEKGEIDPKVANAWGNLMRFNAEIALKVASAVAPERFGQQLNVATTGKVVHEHTMSDDGQRMLERYLNAGGARPMTIEGEVVDDG